MKYFSRCLASISLVMISCIAHAGSYQLNEYSVTGLGRAYAGAGIMGDDYSAIAYNPAGMTLMKQSGIQTGLTMVDIKSDIDGVGKDRGHHAKMNYWTPVPSLFGQVNVNDKWSIGLGSYAPFGLKTRYKANWFGSNTAILSKLDIIDINLATAYKITDQLSLGAGFIMRYIYGHMTNSLSPLVGGGKSDFELDGWTKTALFGLMYEPFKDTRLGLSYRMRSTQQVKGDHKIKHNNYSIFNQTATGWASPALPETFMFSAYQRIKDLGFSLTTRWTHWSQSFNRFSMRSDSRLFQALSGDQGFPPDFELAGQLSGVSGHEKTSYYRYHNSWTITAGLDWYFNKNWTFRCGTGWDQSPTRSARARTIRIPDNDRYWLSAGASYSTDHWQFDLGYTHMFARSGKALEDSDATATHVRYKNLQSYILGLQAQYKF